MRAERTPAPFHVGQVVEICEPGIAVRRAEVVSVKFSPVSGWWVDVREPETRSCWTVTAAHVRALDEVAPR